MATGKKFKKAIEQIDREKRYLVADGAKLLMATKIPRKWDETIDIAVRLGVNPKHADQMVRGAVVLPHGTGKSIRVCVIAKGDKAKDALEAGADYVGAEDLVEKIQKENFLDFDSMVATPDMMGLVGRLGRVLGPRGLMPNPKVGTVTPDVGKAVRELKGGRVEFRVEKAGIIHAAIGKMSFTADKVADNINALLELLVKLKPASAKGVYIKSVTVSATMGPGIKLDPSAVLAKLEAA